MKILNRRSIASLIRIRDPFLMVDKIENIEIDKSSTGSKKIAKDSWFF